MLVDNLAPTTTSGARRARCACCAHCAVPAAHTAYHAVSTAAHAARTVQCLLHTLCTMLCPPVRAPQCLPAWRHHAACQACAGVHLSSHHACSSRALCLHPCPLSRTTPPRCCRGCDPLLPKLRHAREERQPAAQPRRGCCRCAAAALPPAPRPRGPGLRRVGNLLQGPAGVLAPLHRRPPVGIWHAHCHLPCLHCMILPPPPLHTAPSVPPCCST